MTANPLVPADLRGGRADARCARGLTRLEQRLEPALGAPGELVVVATGWLGVLPWSMLPSRRGPADRRRAVGAPLDDVRRHGEPRPRPGQRRGRAGAAARRGRRPRRSVGCGPGASVARGRGGHGRPDDRACSGSPGIVHLAAHGRHEPDNPLFSSVRMADGPLFAHELDSGGGRRRTSCCCPAARSAARASGPGERRSGSRACSCAPASAASSPRSRRCPTTTALRGDDAHARAAARTGVPVAQARRDGDRGGRGRRRGVVAPAGLLRRARSDGAIWWPRGRCRTLSGTQRPPVVDRSCARSARARSPEVPQQRRPAQVRVPGWFGCAELPCTSPAPARGSFVFGAGDDRWHHHRKDCHGEAGQGSRGRRAHGPVP